MHHRPSEPDAPPVKLPVALPVQPGCYALLLHLEGARSVTVGALGTFTLPSGWYVYCGSAHGSGGLRARVHRHLRASPVLHWHVDYLRSITAVVDVWLWPGAPRAQECLLAATFAALPGARRPVPGFGSSDCRCAGHLIGLTPDVPAGGRLHSGFP